MSDQEAAKLTELIEEVAMRHWARISIKLFVMIAAATISIVTTLIGGTWYVANTLRSIEYSISSSKLVVEDHETRLIKIESITASPRSRWTVSMMLDWATLMRDWAPGMPTPSVLQIQAAHLHEITP